MEIIFEASHLNVRTQGLTLIQGHLSWVDKDRYIPDASYQFECLFSGERIPFTSVNDQFCDCSDGSDEPGTSLCLVLPLQSC